MGTRREIEEKKESVVMSSSSSSSSREWTPEEEGKGGGEEGDAQKRGGRRLVWLPVTALVATGVCYAIMYGFFFRSDKDPEEEQPDVAYISEVGDYPPQSCFFTLGCSLLGAAHIAAFVALATETQARLSVAVRSLPPSQAPLLARYVSSSTRMFWAGIIAGMGFMVTGSFQEVHVPTVHIIGALAVFVASICLFLPVMHHYCSRQHPPVPRVYPCLEVCLSGRQHRRPPPPGGRHRHRSQHRIE